jgi:hypothetical protein
MDQEGQKDPVKAKVHESKTKTLALHFFLSQGCNLHQPRPQGDHGQHNAHQGSAVQIGGLD